ncbi:MAG: ABC transporter permease, partial [Blastocatellia bacterium]|nr:ABC transporter permease [Blastocatellia bacterium]
TAIERELDEEIFHHIERQTEQNIRLGMSPEDARAAARKAFGGIDQAKERSRDARGLRWLEELWHDLQFGMRMLRRNPGFTTVAILSLALGIGANTAIFSVFYAVLLRPLPYRDPNHLVLIFSKSQEDSQESFTLEDFTILKTQSRSFEAMAVYYRNTGFSRVSLTGSAEPEVVQGGFVSADFFPLLGISPQIGRFFTPAEEINRNRVVILSQVLWNRRFGAAPDVIGRSLQIDGADFRVIGVMPATFQFPARDTQFWAPISMNRYWLDRPARDTTHGRRFYARWNVVARLKPAVSLQQARAEMNILAKRLEQVDPELNEGRGINALPLRVELNGNTNRALFLLLAAALLVLLIACGNVANLMLARGIVRQREMAIRTALGAGRARLIRQLITESVLMAILSGFLGLYLAAVGVPALIALAPPDIPRLEEAGMDPMVLVFTLGVSLLAAFICGLVPAWNISQSDPVKSLNSGNRGSSSSIASGHARNLLVIAEIALSVVLLVSAGLLIRSLLALQSVDAGFEPEHALTMRITLPAGAPEHKKSAFLDLVLERVRALPGVKTAGAIDGLFQLSGAGNLGLRSIEGRMDEPREQWTALTWKTIGGEYWQAMGTPLLRGRFFSDSDGQDSPLVALINESMARRYWPNEDPIGKRFKGQDRRGRNDDWLTVIGVVRDMRSNGLERQATPYVFEWHRQSGVIPSDLVARITGDPATFAETLRSAVRSLDQTAIISSVKTMEEQLSEQTASRRFQTSLLSLFSLIALALASIGVYGVMRYLVVQRTNEIGIRMALGAQIRDVLLLIIGEGMKLALVGELIGLGGGWMLTRSMKSLLFGVSTADPVTFVVSTLLLSLVALLACSLPAWRATKVDPISALRN